MFSKFNGYLYLCNNNARHEKVMMDWARSRDCTISKVYHEGHESTFIASYKDSGFNRLFLYDVEDLFCLCKYPGNLIDSLERHGIFVEIYTLSWLDIYAIEGGFILNLEVAKVEYRLAKSKAKKEEGK